MLLPISMITIPFRLIPTRALFSSTFKACRKASAIFNAATATAELPVNQCDEVVTRTHGNVTLVRILVCHAYSFGGGKRSLSVAELRRIVVVQRERVYPSFDRTVHDSPVQVGKFPLFESVETVCICVHSFTTSHLIA